MPGLVDPDAIPYFYHPMNRVAKGFYDRQPYPIAMGGGVALDVACFRLDLGHLEAFLAWAEGLEPTDPAAGYREDALETGRRLIDLLDWRWYAWEALRRGVVLRDGDGPYAVRLAPHGEEEHDIFVSESREKASEEWVRLARMVVAGVMDGDTLRVLLGETAIAELTRCGKRPPELP